MYSGIYIGLLVCLSICLYLHVYSDIGWTKNQSQYWPIDPPGGSFSTGITEQMDGQICGQTDPLIEMPDASKKISKDIVRITQTA